MNFFFRFALLATLWLSLTVGAQTAPTPSSVVAPSSAKPATDDVQKLDAYRVEGVYSGLEPKPATTISIVSTTFLELGWKL